MNRPNIIEIFLIYRFMHSRDCCPGLYSLILRYLQQPIQLFRHPSRGGISSPRNYTSLRVVPMMESSLEHRLRRYENQVDRGLFFSTMDWVAILRSVFLTELIRMSLKMLR